MNYNACVSIKDKVISTRDFASKWSDQDILQNWKFAEWTHKCHWANFRKLEEI
jgi:hypothetical protein